MSGDVIPVLAAIDPWRWQAHPEVWFLVLATVVYGILLTVFEFWHKG